MKKFNLFLKVAVLLTTTFSYAQLDFGTLLGAGTGDATALFQGYLEPVGKGLGNGINSGWNTTAKTHKLFGLDLGVTVNAAIVPKDGETYTFDNANFTRFKLDDSNISTAQMPTIFGSTKLEDRPLMEITDSNTGEKISFSSLPGLFDTTDMVGFNAVPAPTIQLGLGIIKNTDLKLRYVPKQKTDEFEASTLGFGIKHNLNQWFPGEDSKTFFMSVFAGYTNMNTQYHFDIDANPTQAFDLDVTGMTYQLLASKKLSILTLYGGVGYNTYDTKINLLGDYTTVENITYTDPVSLAYSGKYISGTLGLSLKLLFLNIGAEYNKQQYDTVSATVGFTFDKKDK